jgi:hypothetical protein
MPQAQTIKKQLLRKQILRRVAGGFSAKPDNPAENLVEFVKVLEKIEITPEKLALNSKYIVCADGSRIEY